MKLVPHLKKGLRVYLKDSKTLILSFLLLPIILALVYGNMQKDMFEGKVHATEGIKVDFQYNESTGKGTVFKDIISQKKVKEFITQEKESAEYRVIIDDDFKNVEIQGKDEGAAQFIVLKNFMKVTVNNFNQYEVIQDTISSLNISNSDKIKLTNNLVAALNSSNDKPLVKENIIEGYRTLDSMEYYTISIFSFTTLVMIVTLAGYFYKEVKEGIVKRSLSTPNDKRDYFLGFVLTTFITTISITALYILINRLRGVAFQDNPLYLLIIILLQSLLTTSVVGLVIAFIKKEVTANIIMNLVLVVPSIFGGAFFYSEFIGSKAIRAIMDCMPNALILNSYKDLAITSSLQAIQGKLILMAVLSLVILVISIVKIERQWEV